jgi:cytochrome P450
LRASVGSTEASNGRLARVGVVGPTRASIDSTAPDPDRLGVGREDIRHVAFGMGPHDCLGAPLARLEGAVVFSTLLRRFPDLHLADGPPPEYRDNLNLRGLRELRVESSVSH